MRDAIEQFRTAIHDAGLTPPEVIEPDGKLHPLREQRQAPRRRGLVRVPR